MVAAPEYDLATQTKIVTALCVLHNFIRVHNPDEDLGQLDEVERRSPSRVASDFGGTVSPQEKARAKDKRDRIANAMWQDYQDYLQQNSV